MGLFTKDQKFKFKQIPSTPEQDEARSYLTNLFRQNLSFPELQVADLTGNEQRIQSYISNYLSGFGQDYNLARKYYTDVLEGEYDPAESQYYQGIRNQLDTQKGEAQAQVRRTAQKAGSARSTPFLGIEARTGAEYDTQKDVVLGGLLQDERQFRAQAASGLSDLRGQEVAQLSAADQLAAKERMIQQMRFQAAYEKILNELLAPYTYNAQIASYILNEQRYMGVQTGGGLSDLGVLGMMGGSILGGIAAGGLAGGTAGPGLLHNLL